MDTKESSSTKALSPGRSALSFFDGAATWCMPGGLDEVDSDIDEQPNDRQTKDDPALVRSMLGKLRRLRRWRDYYEGKDTPYFLQLLRTEYPQLWYETVLSTDAAVLCVPQSTSLASGGLNRQEVEAHILLPSKVPGEYSTVNGWTVNIIGDQVVCGQGFPTPTRKVRLLLSEDLHQCLNRMGWPQWSPENKQQASKAQPSRSKAMPGEGEKSSRDLDRGVSDVSGEKPCSVTKVTSKAKKVSDVPVSRKKATARMVHLSRPLLGGLESVPEHMQEMDTGMATKYTALLRSHPELEAVFLSMDQFVEEVGRVFMKGGRACSDTHRVKVIECVREQWRRCSVWLIESSCLQEEEGGNYWGCVADPEQREVVLMQVCESYLMKALHPWLFPWLARPHDHTEGVLGEAILLMRYNTQSDFGIKASFQCNLTEASRSLCRLSSHTTPMDKMLQLKECVRNIHASLQVHLDTHPQYHQDDSLQLATDDLVLLLAFSIVGAYPWSCCLVNELRYIKAFHFCASDTSALGFALSTLEVAVDWLVAKVGYGLTEDPLGDSPEADQTHGLPPQLEGILTLRPREFELGDGGAGPGAESWGMGVSVCCVGTDVALQSNLAHELGRRGLSLRDYDHPLRALHHLLPEERPMVGQREGEGEGRGASRASYASGLPMAGMQGGEGATVAGQVFPSHPANDFENAPGTGLNRMASRMMVLGDSAVRGGAGEQSQVMLEVMSDDDGLQRPACVMQVACGEHYSAAVTLEGELHTWGLDEAGRLGHGADVDAFFPVSKPAKVMALHTDRVVQVSCGASHVLIVTSVGELFAWGDNRFGQCGIHCTQGSNSMARTSSISSTGIAPPATPLSGHTGGRLHKGTSGGWENSATREAEEGRRGRGMSQALSQALTSISRPTEVVIQSGISDASQVTGKQLPVVQVACGRHHSLALVDDASNVGNTLYSWGRALFGRLGRIPQAEQDLNYPTPTPVPADWSFRVNDHRDQGKALLPVPVSPVAAESSEPVKGVGGGRGEGHPTGPVGGLVHIAAGWSHSVAVTGDGAVFTWGCGVNGRLGQGSQADVYKPQQVRALASQAIHIRSAAAGYGHTLFLSSLGSVFSCGFNQHGQCASLGPTPVNATTVSDESGDGGAELKAAHSRRGSRSTITCNWRLGRGDGGSRGPSEGSPETTVPGIEEEVVLSPRPVLGRLSSLRVVAVAAGENHSAVIVDTRPPVADPPAQVTNSGGRSGRSSQGWQGGPRQVFAWGLNSGDQCGQGRMVESVSEPREVGQLQGARGIACGAGHTLVVL